MIKILPSFCHVVLLLECWYRTVDYDAWCFYYVEGLVLDGLGWYRLKQEQHWNQEPRTVLEPRTKNGTRAKNQERYRSQEPRTVPEPRTRNGTGAKNQEWYKPRTKNGTGAKNQERYRSQEPRTVPEPRTKSGAGAKGQELCLANNQELWCSVPQGINKESDFGSVQSLV